MSMMTNEGVNMYCKSVTDQEFVVVGIIVKLGEDMSKPKGFS